jgi:hypothetical protein
LSILLLLAACEASGGAGSGQETSAGAPSKIASIGSLRGGDRVASASYEGGGVRAVVKHGPATVSGGLDAEIVQREVRARLGAIRACYEHELRSDPNLAGDVVIRWSIILDGRVQDVRVESDTLKSEETIACAVSLVHRWRFPVPSSAVAVSFPFEFRSAREDQLGLGDTSGQRARDDQ